MCSEDTSLIAPAPKWWKEAATIVFNKTRTIDYELVEDAERRLTTSKGLQEIKENLMSMLSGSLNKKEKELKDTLIEDCSRLMNVYGSENW